MKRIIFFFFFFGFWLAFANLIFAQKIHEVVYRQNSGNQPVSGVKIRAFGCNSVFSDSDGVFVLDYPNKKVGQKIKLILGGTDGNQNAIAWVNEKQFEYFQMADSGINNPIQIIVPSHQKFNDAKIKFYDILEKNAIEANQKLLKEIDRKLDKATKLEEHQKLQNQKEQLQKKLENALKKIEQEKDIHAALRRCLNL